MAQRVLGRALGVLIILCVAQGVGFAQTRVRVRVDQANIWRPGFLTVATVVKRGALLDVISRRGEWLEVLVPFDTTRAHGMIGVAQVELVEGTLPEDSAPGVRTEPAKRPSANAETNAGGVGFRVFGDLGYTRFNASRSFEAVLGSPGGFLYGGGAGIVAGPLFVQGAIERFQRTGERVVVLNDETFGLGIDDTVTVLPISVTAGYRHRMGTLAPYAGAGVSFYSYKEESDFAAEGDNVDTNSTGFHVLGGIEFRNESWIATGFEAQYTHMPDDLEGGVAAIFDEHALGGFQFRVKVIFGR